MNRNAAVALVVLLPLVGMGVGYLAGPALARTDQTVRLAARVWLEEREGLTERTLESEAFRLTGGADRAALFEKAGGVVRRFRIGTALFGLWCGLVLGLKALTLSSPTGHTEFEVDHAWCVSCGRCYRWCPREQLRLVGKAAEPSAASPGATPS